MVFIKGGLIVLAVAIVAMNIISSRSLWRGHAFERSQKVIQTILIWTIPGMSLVVHYLLREPSTAEDSDDPTVHSLHGVDGEIPFSASHGHGDDHG
jgi:hypothetical protein